MAYARAVTAQLLDTDGSTVITGALDNSFNRRFTDIGNDFGRGEVSLGLEDANYTELTRGRYVRILVGGTTRFTFKIRGDLRFTEQTVGEEIRLARTASGLGWGCVFNEAVLHPEPGVESPLDYAHRLWSFASIVFPNATTWDPAVERYEYKDGISYGARVISEIDPGADPDDTSDDVLKLYPAPKDFPWPNAPKNGNGSAPTPTYDPVYWVTADGAPSEESIGYHFFIGSFELDGEQQVTFHVTADNLFILFCDGVPIIEEVGDTLVWKGWKQHTLTLPDGDHVIALVCENVAADVDYNPAGALFDVIAEAVYPGDVETSLTLSLLTSGATDLVKSFFSADDWPGWFAGQIIPDAVAEAQAQGALDIYAGDTFTGGTDTDGNTWPAIPIFAMDIGRSLGEMLQALHAQWHIDWHFHPDTLTLDAWVRGQAGTSSGVDFHYPTDPDDPDSGNIQELQRGEVKPYANYLLVQWSGGTTVVEDTVEQAAYGSVVQGFFRCDAASLSEAQTLGGNELDERKLSATAGVSMQILPTSTADCPYEAFDMFDYVTIPQADGTGTDSVQVLTIDLDEDAEGWAIWKLEVNRRMRAPARETLDILQVVAGLSGGITGAARE